MNLVFCFTNKMQRLLLFFFGSIGMAYVYIFFMPDQAFIEKQAKKSTQIIQTYSPKSKFQANVKISINLANKSDLCQIPGVGEKTAEKIILYRTKHPFRSLSELMNIKGIGPKKFLKMKKKIRL